MSVQKENFAKNVAQKKKKKKSCSRAARIVFIGPTLILIRTLRLSMRNFPWEFDTTMRLGDGISKIGSTARTTRIGIGTRNTIRGVVAETLLRIVEAIPGTRWETTGSARAFRGTRKKVTTVGIDVASLRLIQRGIDQTTVSVLKLMMIIPVYAHYSMLRRLL